MLLQSHSCLVALTGKPEKPHKSKAGRKPALRELLQSVEPLERFQSCDDLLGIILPALNELAAPLNVSIGLAGLVEAIMRSK